MKPGGTLAVVEMKPLSIACVDPSIVRHGLAVIIYIDIVVIVSQNVFGSVP